MGIENWIVDVLRDLQGDDEEKPRGRIVRRSRHDKSMYWWEPK